MGRAKGLATGAPQPVQNRSAGVMAWPHAEQFIGPRRNRFRSSESCACPAQWARVRIINGGSHPVKSARNRSGTDGEDIGKLARSDSPSASPPRWLRIFSVALRIGFFSLPVLTLAWWLAWSASSAVERAVHSQARLVAASAMDAIEQLLLDRRKDVVLLVGMPTVKTLDPVVLTPVLDHLVTARQPAYRLALVTDIRGQILAANQVDGEGRPIASGPLIGRTVAQEPWFQRVLQASQPVMVEGLRDDPLAQTVFGPGQPVLAMSLPIKDDLGAAVGVLSVRLSFKPLHDVLEPRTAFDPREDGLVPILFEQGDRAIAGAVSLAPEFAAAGLAPLVTVPAAGFMAAAGLPWRLAVYAAEQQPLLPDSPPGLVGLGLCAVLAWFGAAWAVVRFTPAPLPEAASQSDAALPATAEPIKLALSAGRIGTWDWDIPADRVTCSEEIGPIYGLPKAVRELTFEASLAAVHPDDREQVAQAVEAAVEQGADYEMEFRNVWPDGSIHWVAATGTAHRDPETGKTVRMVGVSRCITDRKQAEQRLEKMNRCFLSFGKDPDENIAKLTALAGELLGATCALYSRLEDGLLCALGQWHTPPGFKPVDKPDGHICHDVILKAGTQLLVVRDLPQTPYAQTDPNVLPYKLQTYWGIAVLCQGRAIGSLCTVFQADVVPGEADEKLLGIVASAIGVEEERKQAEAALGKSEEQVRQLQKMDVVGRLAGDIAHDFNNLLTIILGHAELLHEELDPQAPLFQPVDEITKAAERASVLTQHLLTFSRKQPRQLQRLNLNEQIAAQVVALSGTVGERSRLVTDLAPDLGLVLADASQIEQVALNLCLNAREAMPNGGTVTIGTGNVTVDDTFMQRHIRSKPGSYVVMSVADQGVGMDDYVQAHCFDPFFTTKPKGESTGLGLSTVYGIVKQSGGFIDVVSSPGQGATFKIYLPCVEAPAAGVAPAGLPLSQKLPRGTETLLLVEDEVGLRMLLWRVLEQQGYTVLDAPSGSAALGLASKHQGPIHLLVTDVVMPEMSGTELARLLNSARPDMKVLYISGYPDETVEGHGVIDPRTTMLSKPFSPDRLARKVREVLDQPAWPPPPERGA